jgi:hypothetical protein
MKVLATYVNKKLGARLEVLDDISYKMTKNGYSSKTDMSKWYVSPQGVVRHIENDIKDGYYEGFVKTEGEGE